MALSSRKSATCWAFVAAVKTAKYLGLGPDDFEGLEGCDEVLVRSRTEAVRGVHASFLEAGCDAVETGSFGASPVLLAERGAAGGPAA